MVKRVWSFVAILITGAVLFFFYQNFIGKTKSVKSGHYPASQHDFNAVIDESLASQAQLAKELEKVHPPERIGKEGLIKREASMKRKVIDGTGESVASKDSQEFFKETPATEIDEVKNRNRLSQELEANP